MSGVLVYIIFRVSYNILFKIYLTSHSLWQDCRERNSSLHVGLFSLL